MAMQPLVECIPNFSEARHPEAIDAIAGAISAVDGAHLLHRSSDLDHNRTVLTFAGAPSAVEAAAFEAIKTAAALIDLNQHTGQHPRIGAADVVPFVPLAGISMEECVAMARRLGERVGRELQIPVYLYEYAASRPERVNLENLRRGEYEGLREDVERDPLRKPDFGPARLGPAGATVIGARDPLIAFNVYLTTSDVTIAKRIAKAIRYSSGGMRFVKAIGLLVDGRAQVSINLTNYRKSPLARVFEMIRHEAARHGAAVHHSELVGLIPQEALADVAVWYTQLDGFSPEQILESRLYAASGAPFGASSDSGAFLEALASPTPAPGGGSAAAYAGALGAALIQMVTGLTVGKAKYKNVEPAMLAMGVEAQRLRHELQRAVEDDAAAFEAVMGAYRLPKGTDLERSARDSAVQLAMLAAAEVPLRTASDAVQVMELSWRCAKDGNINAISDAASAGALARAALVAAAYNVRINLRDVEDRMPSEKMLKELAALEVRAGNLDDEIQAVMRERGGLA